MAERRMFTQKITDSDAFTEMPLSAQALYFHLNMHADDDGFLNNANKIRKSVNASEDDFKLLILKRFVIPFESGVVVIKHWRMHNLLRKDRYTPTQYQEEFSTLEIRPIDNAYTEKNELATIWQPNDNQMTTQDSIGKDSIDKVNIKENNTKEKSSRFSPPSLEEVTAFCKERNNNVDPQAFTAFYESKGWKVGKNPMKDWKAAVITWERRWKEEHPEEEKCKYATSGFDTL